MAISVIMLFKLQVYKKLTGVIVGSVYHPCMIGQYIVYNIVLKIYRKPIIIEHRY